MEFSLYINERQLVAIDSEVIMKSLTMMANNFINISNANNYLSLSSMNI